MKIHFSKEVIVTKKDNEGFENSTKCWTCDNVYVGGEIIVISPEHRGSAHRDCNIKVELNHKILVAFHNLESYDSHLIMQELSKFHFKINLIQNEL